MLNADLRDVVIGGVLLAVVVDEDASHADVRDDGRVLLLSSYSVSAVEESGVQRGRTEYSQRTKLLVSRQVMSPMPRSDSPSDFLILRPLLSFFFFELRTLVKLIGTFAGNWSAGRWNERVSFFVRRVLYCSDK